MTTGVALVHGKGQAGVRVVAVFALIASLAVFGARDARARYDWCSVDPTFLFHRAGDLVPYALDVQVLVPLAALPLAEAATLTVGVPADLRAQEALNTSTPIFELQTTLTTLRNRLSSSGVPVKVELLVPASAGAVPVRLVITDPQAGTVTITEGQAGQKVWATVEVPSG